jgi:hypothetical protein
MPMPVFYTQSTADANWSWAYTGTTVNTVTIFPIFPIAGSSITASYAPLAIGSGGTGRRPPRAWAPWAAPGGPEVGARRAAEMGARRAIATVKAAGLLEACLAPAQLADYQERGWFYVTKLIRSAVADPRTRPVRQRRPDARRR